MRLRDGTSFGPFDYRTERDKVLLVEQHHFTPEVENLIRASADLWVLSCIMFSRPLQTITAHCSRSSGWENASTRSNPTVRNG
jgi:hypothetical protein